VEAPAVKTFIVEDSPVILDNLVAALEELAPVQVVGTAPDEAAAMHWLRERGDQCDLVIIDVFLKSGSGLGVLRGTAQARLAAKRVVLTNYATEDMRAKCAELGAHRVFDKSNELDELLAYCTRLADGAADTAPGALA
jgi:DNA-binding NarL/FixJ family response regulator